MSVLRLALFVALSVLVCSGNCRAQNESIPFYIGKQACLECHSPEDPDNGCALEQIPKHGQAFDVLAKEEAEHIALLCGVGAAPQESRICLRCHSTAADVGPRWTLNTFEISDGVQCEACHGAASLHADEYRYPEKKLSFKPQQKMSSMDALACESCHRAKPSHEAVLKSGFRKSSTDSLYHTPVNLTISPEGDLLYVVCANSNKLAVVDLQTGVVLDEISVGRRPHDVAVSPDGQTLYVTNRLSDSLSIIDEGSRTVVGEIAVGDEPHGVITDVTGQLIFVLNTAQDSISVIDARQLTEIKRLATGPGPWSAALRPDGLSLCVTSVWPHLVPFREPPLSEVTNVAVQRQGEVLSRSRVSEANMLQGIAVVPDAGATLFTLMRTKNLVPITRLAQGWTVTNGLGVLWSDGRVDQVLLDEPNSAFPDPADVAVSPNGRYALVTSGGSDQVAVVDVTKLLDLITGATAGDRKDVLPNHLGMSSRFVLKRIAVGSNPRGVVFSPDGRFAYVVNALDDSVSVIETEGFTRVKDINLGGPIEISKSRWGEKLFHNANITYAQQFSCRSCHPDGHVNGLTFDIEADGIGMNPVDNRTLRGILDTAPFKWEGNNPTLSRQCGPRLAVFFTRLNPFTPQELSALVQYISTIERPPNRNRRSDGLTIAQRRGKVIFERTTTNHDELIAPERRCITCHSGPNQNSAVNVNVGSTMWFDAAVDPGAVDLADISLAVEQHGELGLYYFVDTGTPTRAFDVPHLNNIYDSAPYMHNGAAGTLQEIWTTFDVLTLHGSTSDLTRQQFNDLIEYLKAM